MTVSAQTQRERWTILELIQWTAQHFAERGIESARLDAEILLANALGTTRLQLYLDYEKPVCHDARARFRTLVARRGIERVPVSQLVGEKEFWSLSMRVTPDVLTPRPETETLVMAALEQMPDLEYEYRVLDLGTGSGAIALALASERPRAQVLATDVSAAALKVAAETADQLQLNENVRFAQGNLFEGLAEEEFDLVISNPPYLGFAERGTLPPELEHEPEAALFAGEDGMAVLKPLVFGVRDVLKGEGVFAVEFAPHQADAVAGWCAQAGFSTVEIRRDLAERPRIVVAKEGTA